MEGVYLKYHMKRILVGISGASGAPIAIRLLQRLKVNQDIETHLIMTDSACLTIEQETEYSVQQVQSLADVVYDIKKIGAKPASGSFQIDKMIIVPCSMKTLSSIANGYASNTITRVADVSLKEHRKTVIVPRETPLRSIHLENMLNLSKEGAVILPAMPGFYSDSDTVDDQINFIVGKILDSLNIENNIYKRWE